MVSLSSMKQLVNNKAKNELEEKFKKRSRSLVVDAGLEPIDSDGFTAAQYRQLCGAQLCGIDITNICLPSIDVSIMREYFLQKVFLEFREDGIKMKGIPNMHREVYRALSYRDVLESLEYKSSKFLPEEYSYFGANTITAYLLKGEIDALVQAEISEN